MKTNKSYTKRLRVTKSGKILARKKGQNHYNAKDSGSATLSKGRTVEVKMKQKDRSRFLSGQ